MIAIGFLCLAFLSSSPRKAVMPLMFIGLIFGVIYDVATGRMPFGKSELWRMLIVIVSGTLRHTAVVIAFVSLLFAIIYQDVLKSSLFAASAIALLLLARLSLRVYFRAIIKLSRLTGAMPYQHPLNGRRGHQGTFGR